MMQFSLGFSLLTSSGRGFLRFFWADTVMEVMSVKDSDIMVVPGG